MRFRTLITGMAIGLAIAACGGSSGSDEPGQRPTPTVLSGLPFTQEEAFAAAEQALLRLEDFPTGWTERPAADDDSALDLPPECQEPDHEGKVAEADSLEFHGPDDEEVDSGVTVYANETAAANAVGGAVTYLEDCRDPLGDAMKRFIEESEDAPVEDFQVEVNVDRLSFPTFGDESAAWRISVIVTSSELPFDVDFYIDALGVRVGNIVGGITSVDFLERPDTDMGERLLAIIEGRMRSATTVLD